MLLTNVQKEIFSNYQSLNLRDKIYQVKALSLAQKYLRTTKRKPNLLDIGCADGSFCQYAGTLLRANTYGIDISPKSIKTAKKVLDNALQHDLAIPLPFADNTFVIIFALEVIEHIYDTDLLISEIRRVLRPGGVVIFSTPNLASLRNRIALLFNKYPQYLEYSTKGAGHIHVYTSNILIQQITQHNLKILQLTSPNFVAPFVTNPKAPFIYRKIMMKLGDLLPTFGSHIIVVAEK